MAPGTLAPKEASVDAIEMLMDEHRLIERAIDALVAFADEVRRKVTDDRVELGRFVTFIREFADACHHGKEEDILFERLAHKSLEPGLAAFMAELIEDHVGIGPGKKVLAAVPRRRIHRRN